MNIDIKKIKEEFEEYRKNHLNCYLNYYNNLSNSDKELFKTAVSIALKYTTAKIKVGNGFISRNPEATIYDDMLVEDFEKVLIKMFNNE
jgi:hypothetical protein